MLDVNMTNETHPHAYVTGGQGTNPSNLNNDTAITAVDYEEFKNLKDHG